MCIVLRYQASLRQRRFNYLINTIYLLVYLPIYPLINQSIYRSIHARAYIVYAHAHISFTRTRITRLGAHAYNVYAHAYLPSNEYNIDSIRK